MQNSHISQSDSGMNQSNGSDYWPTGNHRQFGRYLDPVGMIQAVLDNKWLIFLSTLLFTALAIAYVTLAVPTYQAITTVEVTPSSPNLITFDDQNKQDRTDVNFLQTQIELLRSRGVAQRVIEKLELKQLEEFQPKPSSGFSNVVNQALIDNQVTDLFLEKLTVEQIEFTQLVQITYESTSADIAANISNAIAEEYIEAHVERRNALSSNAVDSISLRLASLKDNLEASEKKLLDFKLSNNIVNVDGGVGRLEEQQILLSSSELVNAKSSLSQISNVRNEMRNLQGNPRLLSTLPQIYNDPLIRQTRSDLNDEQRKLSELSNKYGNKHPLIVNASSRITSLNNSLQSYTQQIVDRIDKEYRQLSSRVAVLESTLQQGKSGIQNFGAKRIELEAIEDEVATNRDIYSTFFNRLLEFNSIRGLESDNAVITEFAYPPSEPFKPSKKIIVLLAFLGSLILSTLIAVMTRVFDNTIASTRDVDSRTGLKLLGIIPYSNTQNRSSWLPWSKAKDSNPSESLNILCANIRLADRNGENKLIMITSSAPDEGKTTTAVQLAAAMSKSERVLLVDADLRKGSLSKAVGIGTDGPGLTNFVLGDGQTENTIKYNDKTEFYFMSCGTAVDQPLALLSSKAFERKFRELALIYDRVIFDCPPIHAVSDPKVISRMADSVIYLIKAKDTPSLLVERGITALRELNANIIGAVVTQVNVKNMNNFGGVYDFHGFHDHYGYAKTVEGGKTLKLAQSDLQRLNEDEGQYLPRRSAI